MRTTVLRPLYLLTLLILTFGSVTGCRSRHDEPYIRPTIDTTDLTMRVGETAEVHVADCTELRAIPEADIIEVSVGRGTVFVTALAEGRTSVSIYADGVLLRCRVVVDKADTPFEGEDNKPTEPDDDAVQLSDDSWRYESAAMTMRYDTPGTIFEHSRDGHRFTVRSLSTGNVATVILAARPAVVGSIGCTALTINGETVDIDRCEVARISGPTVWLRLHTADWGHTIWFVADIF